VVKINRLFVYFWHKTVNFGVQHKQSLSLWWKSTTVSWSHCQLCYKISWTVTKRQ